MDFKNLGNLGDMNGGMPDISKLAGSFGGKGLGKPDYVKSNEFGVHTGNTFDGIADYELPSLDIDSITFRSGMILDGVSVIYSDGSTVRHGGSGGGANEIALKGDTIKQICGVCKVGFDGRRTLSSVYLVTERGKQYGPFGSQNQGEKFEISRQGHKLVALFGSTDGNYIASLGAYLVKL